MNIDFFDIKIGALTRDEMVNKILELTASDKRSFITYINAHCFNVSFSNQEYKKILNAADLVYAGGKGIVWASRFLGSGLPERVNILDFFDKLEKELINRKISIYLLGGEKDVVKGAKAVLKKRGLNIIGARHGFFSKEEEKDIIKEINVLRPNILMVGMGVPKQEKWIYSYLNELDTKLFWAVGAVFEWLSGYRKRAPEWMIKSGLEWLHRLYQQPVRLCSRYLLGNLIFIYHVLRLKFKLYD